MPAPALPRYGEAALADLIPSLLSGLGVPGFANPLQVPRVRAAGVLLIDGLGLELIRSHAALAPFLAGNAGAPLTAGFPSTTAASLASIGTGRAPGEHGLAGYTIHVPGHAFALNVLRWAPYGIGELGDDARQTVVPEQVQPDATAFQRAAAAGVTVTAVGPPDHAHSGLTRAVFRGARYRSSVSLADTVAQVADALRQPGPRFAYGYFSALDLIGHMRGVDSDAWRLQLQDVDRAAAALTERIPSGCALVITGDHGMLDLPSDGRIDIDADARLRSGVVMLTGEPRARHIHTAEGAAPDVLAAWRERLGDQAWVVPGEEAVAAGWFGPRVTDRTRERIGDVVVAALGPVGIFQRSVDPAQWRMTGHHGSMTAAEQLVPFALIVR